MSYFFLSVLHGLLNCLTERNWLCVLAMVWNTLS